MSTYGITLTQLAKYTAMVSSEMDEVSAAINKRGFYERFCAAQDFAKLLGENISVNNIDATDYAEWKMKILDVQRSSTPHFGSRDTELLVEEIGIAMEKENAALLILMGQGVMEDYASIDLYKSNDYTKWEIVEVHRSSTPLLGSRREELCFQFENEDAALLMLMGQGVEEDNASINMYKSFEAFDYSEWEMSIQNVHRSSTPLLGPTVMEDKSNDYTEWEFKTHEVQRSSTPLYGSREPEELSFQCVQEDAALLMLMGQGVMEGNASISMYNSNVYTEWEMHTHEVQRASTPLHGSREPEELSFQFEKGNAALFMLMGQGIIESVY